MWRWCSQIACDYIEFSFNPLRLISAPPPHPQLRPLFSELLLIATLVNPAHGTQGCPKKIFFDKNHWHFNFWLILFRSHFSLLLNTRTFFAIPLTEKMHSLFSASHQSERILFPLFSSLWFLFFLNKCANYSYRRILKPPCKPCSACPWFYGGERQIMRTATPCFMALAPNFTTSAFPIPNYFTFKNFCYKSSRLEGKMPGRIPTVSEYLHKDFLLSFLETYLLVLLWAEMASESWASFSPCILFRGQQS